MTGKESREPTSGSLQLLFARQSVFQYKVSGMDTPVDSPRWFQYHMTAMTEELGEVLKADKRWKTHRNAHYDFENKLEELADVFITAMNLALFSGIDADTMIQAISAKISENTHKFDLNQKLKAEGNG
jgi:NTP pyrophosphatase (non-canonical NTP hydrolase)